MTIDTNTFREYLTLYGTQLESWPQAARVQAKTVQHQPAFLALIEEEKRFERILRLRHMETAPTNLAQRIITMSLAKGCPLPQWSFTDILTSLKPAALAAMLILGFAIGFGALTIPEAHNQTTFSQSMTDDEGSVL